jgi:hypothetical protein
MNFTPRVLESLTIGLAIIGAVTACGESATAELISVNIYPVAISDSCRDGVAQIYDECSDQTVILHEARESAEATGKSVLIVYGAEWCIWCHVFEKYVRGQSRNYEYSFEYKGESQHWPMRERENQSAESDARELNKYVADNFVIANIEGYYSPNGTEVIADTGYDVNNLDFVPLFIVLDADGKYAGHMQSVDLINGLEIRADSGEEYRGYDRKLLLRELKKLRNASIDESTR